MILLLPAVSESAIGIFTSTTATAPVSTVPASTTTAKAAVPAAATKTPTTATAATAAKASTAATAAKTTAATATAAALAVFHGPGLVHNNLPRPHAGAVHFLDRRLRFLVGAHFHEAEALGT